MKKEGFFHRNNKHPTLKPKLTFGQRSSDRLSEFAGSWGFIFGLIIFIFLWMFMNVYAFVNKWDPFPFILLNLGLSCLATFQAPVILMAQNRAAERDRINAKYDYQVNRKAEREIQQIIKSLDNIKRKLK
ncbi:MAG: DUF1003 domain-containing protein [Nanoarchaeota archaeon]|nr:DUF1003 domain-containing protein [Nanoarchaeota archaeon]